MSEAAADTMSERLARLERQHRRLQRGALAAVVGAAAVAVMGYAPGARVVEAQRFVLTDADNRVRAELAAGDHSVLLRFTDEEGRPRLSLGTENGSALVVLNAEDAQMAAHLVALPHGAPGLTLYDAAGRVRAELTLTREGDAALTFLGKNGAPRTTLPSRPRVP